MKMLLKSAIAAAALALMPMAAQAVTLTVVSFTGAAGGQNLTYKNNGTAGWSLSTLTPKNVVVSLEDFSGNFVTNVAAKWSISGNGTSYAVNTSGNQWSQAFSGGTLSFTSTAAFTLGANSYAAGSNILSLTFTGGDLSGTVGATTGSAQVSIPGDSFTSVSSDFLSFPPVYLTDFSISLSNVTPRFAFGGPGGLGTQANGRFNNFTARGSGDFTADMVPEPETWAMMLLGFGLVGFARRRQVRIAA